MDKLHPWLAKTLFRSLKRNSIILQITRRRPSWHHPSRCLSNLSTLEKQAPFLHRHWSNNPPLKSFFSLVSNLMNPKPFQRKIKPRKCGPFTFNSQRDFRSLISYPTSKFARESRRNVKHSRLDVSFN